MKTEKEITQQVEEALNSIDSLQQLEANNFLFGKIQNRLHLKKQQQQREIKTMAKLSATLVIFIGLNLTSYYFLANSTPQPTPQQKTTAAQALATEYQLTTNTYNY
ncbi:hypothetical protein BDD43_5872 [Mucilaginibacter gracilis]|uniref:Uncharacterized protein n=1 Tax=Mucilaginibacter gracilis TaxID=423350 RepID=A0A495JA68_9SPHI|nr:hypothetical protein [Mucilaginibacter gracilis]RKR85601.1 hypothetical protein BDD43_5872 [Mucilaginibacter gracilis]